ncbi:MAG TPA: SH3 domain-containing protein [Alphaproteobacteria bacterium]|nr:SH3 domain-containing protein [Alphaproteobacteria bacterium]
MSSRAILVASYLGAISPLPALAQSVTPVSPGQGAGTLGTVTPVGPPPGAPVQPAAPATSETVTPVNPPHSAHYQQVRQISPPRVIWLRKNLQLRETPGLAGRPIGTVHAKSAVPVVGEVIGAVNGYQWYEVEVGGTRGFIAAIDLSAHPVN